jgi:DNA-binding PadR family transcriptional regulator
MTPPVFAHGHLRLYLLSLLAERPMHGYELMQALSERFGGTYAPSAGTIYPRLARLEEEGLVTKQVDGRRTVYAATEAGRREVEFRRSELDDIEADVTDSVRRLANDVRASVDDAMRSLRADLAAAAGEARPEPASAPAPDDPRKQARLQLVRAEAALTEFRAEVRAELRREVAAGSLSADTVDLLRSRLSALRQELGGALRP